MDIPLARLVAMASDYQLQARIAGPMAHAISARCQGMGKILQRIRAFCLNSQEIENHTGGDLLSIIALILSIVALYCRWQG